MAYAKLNGKYIKRNNKPIKVDASIDSNIKPENIKKDVEILGVVGSLENSNPVEVATAEEMEALLTADNIGKIYKFVGTSEKYITNAIYIVEEN